MASPGAGGGGTELALLELLSLAAPPLGTGGGGDAFMRARNFELARLPARFGAFSGGGPGTAASGGGAITARPASGGGGGGGASDAPRSRGGGGGTIDPDGRIVKTLPRIRARDLRDGAPPTMERRVAASATCFPHRLRPHDVFRIAASPCASHRCMSTTVAIDVPDSVPIAAPWKTSCTLKGTDSLLHAAETRSRRQSDP